MPLNPNSTIGKLHPPYPTSCRSRVLRAALISMQASTAQAPGTKLERPGWPLITGAAVLTGVAAWLWWGKRQVADNSEPKPPARRHTAAPKREKNVAAGPGKAGARTEQNGRESEQEQLGKQGEEGPQGCWDLEVVQVLSDSLSSANEYHCSGRVRPHPTPSFNPSPIDLPKLHFLWIQVWDAARSMATFFERCVQLASLPEHMPAAVHERAFGYVLAFRSSASPVCSSQT